MDLDKRGAMYAHGDPTTSTVCVPGCLPGAIISLKHSEEGLEVSIRNEF